MVLASQSTMGRISRLIAHFFLKPLVALLKFEDTTGGVDLPATLTSFKSNLGISQPSVSPAAAKSPATFLLLQHC